MTSLPQTVLITGASSGIGRAAALAFAARGWNVAATMRNTDAAADLKSTHPHTFVTRLDVTDQSSITDAVAAVITRFGKIDALVNNAGYMLMGPLESWTNDQLEDQFRTNLFGLVNVTRAVLPFMRLARSGTIINLSSIGGRIGFPLGSAYHATKFAVEGLSESLRYELAPFNIRVKLVEPGGIKTDFINRGMRWSEHPEYTALTAAMRRITQKVEVYAPGPEPVARVIVRAASDNSRKLRYPAKPGPFLALHRILPDHLWSRLITKAMAS
jgi:NAD(P)-dependent dehydrogenase (short-subunit alcohol dehydrogenase family)